MIFPNICCIFVTWWTKPCGCGIIHYYISLSTKIFSTCPQPLDRILPTILTAMPKNPLKDYIWVIENLMKKPMSLSELQDSYYISQSNDDHKELQAKTFYNWRNKIYDLFNIRIEYVGDKYRIEEYEALDRKPALDWLVQSLAVNTALSNSRDLSKRILLENIPSGETYLRPIIEAMKLSRQVKFVYSRFNEGLGREVIAEPYCVKVNNRRWYMLCRVPDGHSHHADYPYLDRFGCIRIYALDRIQRLEILDDTFVYPDQFDPNELFDHHFGVCIGYGVPFARVLVRIAEDHRDYIESLPLHHSQSLVEELDNGDAIYEFFLHPTIDFFRALLSFGADAEVISPKDFRECFAAESEFLYELYNPDE